MLDVLSGNHPEDLHAPPPAPEPYLQTIAREPRPLRIALSLRHAFSGAPVHLHHEIEAGVRRIGRVLSELGHVVSEHHPNYGLMGLTLVARGESGVHGSDPNACQTARCSTHSHSFDGTDRRHPGQDSPTPRADAWSDTFRIASV